MRPIPVHESEFFAQNQVEFISLLTYVAGSSSILEIGSRYGESLKMFASVCKPGAKILSIDIGDDPFTPHVKTSEWWKESLDSLALDGFQVNSVRASSHSDIAINRAKELAPFDFGFIDGDHSTDGAMQDFEVYAPLCRMVALHDINLPAIRPVWAKIKGQHVGRVLEFIHPQSLANGDMGIGLLLPPDYEESLRSKSQ